LATPVPNFQYRWTPQAEEKLGDNFVTVEEYELVVRQAKNVVISRSLRPTRMCWPNGRPSPVLRVRVH
jgi:hypothetical protein